MSDPTTIPAEAYDDALTLWNYHRLDHELRPCSVGMGLGSHDPGVPVYAADLFGRVLYPVLVFTGGNSPTTAKEFPRGEAVHYREIAIEHGVPADQVLTETQSTTTVENFTHTRKLLDERGVEVDSILLTCRPYQQRRAYAHGRKLWPEVEILCSAEPTPLDQYVRQIGSAKRVIDMMVGDLQRLVLTEQFGEAIHQDVPDNVWNSYDRLIAAGYKDRLMGNYPVRPERVTSNG